MRISIWQQFSSNHSAGFEVVGTFVTPAEAEKAASTIAAELKKIQEWYYDPQNGAIVEKRHNDVDEQYKFTPPELDLIERYQLGDSFVPLDWIESEIEKAVGAFDNYVIVTPSAVTWCSYPPFHQLMTRLGAQSVLIAEEATSSIVANVTATVPNPELVDQIKQESVSVMGGKRSADIPDIDFDGKTVHITGIFAVRFSESLPPLIDWLRKLGCTDIQSEFVRIG